MWCEYSVLVMQLLHYLENEYGNDRQELLKICQEREKWEINQLQLDIYPSSAAFDSETRKIHIATHSALHAHPVRLDAKNAIVKYRGEKIDDLSREYIRNPKTTDITMKLRSHRI